MLKQGGKSNCQASKETAILRLDKKPMWQENKSIIIGLAFKHNDSDLSHGALCGIQHRTNKLVEG